MGAASPSAGALIGTRVPGWDRYAEVGRCTRLGRCILVGTIDAAGGKDKAPGGTDDGTRVQMARRVRDAGNVVAIKQHNGPISQ